MKCALVTGGSRGIGRAVCIKMAAMGHHVLVNYKSNQQEADKTISLIKESGGSAEPMPFDVSKKEEIQQKLGGWIETNPDKVIEVLVNNAGIKDDVLMMWMKDEQWENVLRTNLDSFFYITRLVVNSMLLKGLPGQANYSAAKGGVIAATKALAQEVGRRGITVNAVAPGFITTDMTEGIPEKDMKALIPVNRFGSPEEVAYAVGFLASKEAAYITGEVLSVNGGMYT